jgi:hypothetical protein
VRGAGSCLRLAVPVERTSVVGAGSGMEGRARIAPANGAPTHVSEAAPLALPLDPRSALQRGGSAGGPHLPVDVRAVRRDEAR